MTAIEVTFLTGRFIATAHHDRAAHEWPPHGARLFSAMVATWADSDSPDEGERLALEWLEEQPPPSITAPEVAVRRTMSHFVPVNDTRIVSVSSYQNRAAKIAGLVAEREQQDARSDGELTKKARSLQSKIATQRNVQNLVGKVGSTPVKSAMALLPDGRGKKERHFPSVTLVGSTTSEEESDHSPANVLGDINASVTYTWEAKPPDEILEALDGLLARVTRLGHSSSLVTCRLVDEVPEATHQPGEGTLPLRWIQRGQLRALQTEHQRHEGIRPRGLPFRGVSYRESNSSKGDVETVLQPSTVGDWVVFELQPKYRRSPITRTVEFTQVLRRTLLSYAPEPIPEGLSGHLPDSKPTTAPHVSFLALPNVGHEHADGRIMGLAVSLPYGLDPLARNATLRSISHWEQYYGTDLGERERELQLKMGERGSLKLQRKQPPFPLVTLNPGLWFRKSRWWASVTPVALPTHPGQLRRGSPNARARAWARAEEAVAKCCEYVGLPHPHDVRISFSPFVVGTRRASDFPMFRQGRGKNVTARRLMHVAVEFPELVSGPLVLGSGRFLGLGLMRSVVEPSKQVRKEGTGNG